MLHTQFNLMTLRAVWAIHESGSALKAAGLVHRSQPAITAALGTFEKQLERPLFTRNARGMSPTPHGRVLCARVALALTHLRNAESYLATRRNPKAALPFHRLVHETQLAALSALLKTGSFSAAARQLQRAESSVHRSLRELETLCGIKLWERYGSGIEPTPEARELARHGELCWSELAAGLDEMAEQQGIMNGRVTIGSLPLTRSRWLPDAVTRLVSLHPHAQVVIVDGAYGELLRGLRHGQIDFVLGALREVKPEKDIVQTPHFDDQLAIIVRSGHPLAAGFDSDMDKLSAQQLADLSWILPRVDTPARRRFAEFLSYKGVPWPDRAIECSSLVATRALLLQSDHAALLSVRQIGIELETGLLKVLGPSLTGTTRSIGITTREGYRATALQQKLLDLLISSAGQL